MAAAPIVNSRVRRLPPALAALVLLLLPLRAQDDAVASLADTATWVTTEVGDGVVLRQRLLPLLFGSPQSLTVLEVRPGAARFDVVAPGQRTKTSAMGEGGGALAAINGGYFDIQKTGLSVGLLRLDGQLVVPSNDAQGSLGIDRDGALQLQERPRGDWPEVHEALGAGPMLLRGGKLVAPAAPPRHPRSAVGVRRDGGVTWLTVDGRAEQAAGMTFEETARVLLALGCQDALNLDGGGSTTLWVAGRGVCNHPCDDKRFDHEGERTVANALLLHAPAVVVVDDDDAELAGDGWRQRTDGQGFLGSDFASNAAVDARAVFRARLPFAGRYRVLVWRPKLAAEAGVTVLLPGAKEGVRVAGAERWEAAGEFELRGELAVEVGLVCSGEGQRELVVDGVRFVQLRPPDPGSTAK